MTPPIAQPSPLPRGALARAGAAAWRLLGIGALVVAAWWLARQLMGVLIALVLAVLLATLLRPVVRALERRRVPASLAALGAVVLLVVAIAVVFALIIPPFVARIGDVGANVEQGLRQVAYSIAHGVAGISEGQVNRTIDRALDNLRLDEAAVVGDVLAGATAVLQGLAGAVLVLFLAFFLARDGNRLWDWFVRLVPRDRRQDVDEVGHAAWAVLGTYIRGVVFVATVDAVLIAIALVAVGVPLVMPLVVLTWLGAFFPIIGAVVAGMIAVLVALVAVGPGAALAMLAAIVVVQQLEGNVLYPLVVGPRLRLHPVAVLVAVTVGASIGGIPGAFLAVPVATVAAVILNHAQEKRDRETEVALPPSVERADPPSELIVHSRS